MSKRKNNIEKMRKKEIEKMRKDEIGKLMEKYESWLKDQYKVKDIIEMPKKLRLNEKFIKFYPKDPQEIDVLDIIIYNDNVVIETEHDGKNDNIGKDWFHEDDKPLIEDYIKDCINRQKFIEKKDEIAEEIGNAFLLAYGKNGVLIPLKLAGKLNDIAGDGEYIDQEKAFPFKSPDEQYKDEPFADEITKYHEILKKNKKIIIKKEIQTIETNKYIAGIVLEIVKCSGGLNEMFGPWREYLIASTK